MMESLGLSHYIIKSSSNHNNQVIADAQNVIHSRQVLSEADNDNDFIGYCSPEAK